MLISIVITAFRFQKPSTEYMLDAAFELTYIQMSFIFTFFKSVDIDEIHHQCDIENGFEIVMTLLVRNTDYCGQAQALYLRRVVICM